MVKAVLPIGKFAGTHVGRLAVRESGVFDLRTAWGKICMGFPLLSAKSMIRGVPIGMSQLWGEV
ncbi:MAG: hypothetical protein JGK29_21085 [Microcoleus sp. PH2017_17_BER_D_A]|nr:hypothetical protein [Microcoleus sp. PH2017_17_BER_D_A]